MKNKVIIIAAAIVLLALLAGGGYYIWRQQQTIDELTEGFALEKEQLEDEYTQLAIQYEGYKLQVNNDSLEQKLEDQRIKIQRLVEELRQTKAQDARRIAALKKELETVRGVLRYYVAQVDSLNKVNDALIAENQQIRSDMRTVQQQNQQVRQQNETLTKQVTVAAQLSATNVSVTALDRKDKVEKRNRVDKLAKFQVNFTIAANVTAQTGEKDVYLRILRPSDEVLTNAQSGKFKYENAKLDYSARKTIEFGGEETPVTMFYKRGEALDAGTYRVEIYADGNMIGRGSIALKK
jgi:DNA repair exonuclease SbcCD ATPase subunit